MKTFFKFNNLIHLLILISCSLTFAANLHNLKSSTSMSSNKTKIKIKSYSTTNNTDSKSELCPEKRITKCCSEVTFNNKNKYSVWWDGDCTEEIGSISNLNLMFEEKQTSTKKFYYVKKLNTTLIDENQYENRTNIINLNSKKYFNYFNTTCKFNSSFMNVYNLNHTDLLPHIPTSLHKMRYEKNPSEYKFEKCCCDVKLRSGDVKSIWWHGECADDRMKSVCLNGSKLSLFKYGEYFGNFLYGLDRKEKGSNYRIVEKDDIGFNNLKQTCKFQEEQLNLKNLKEEYYSPSLINLRRKVYPEIVKEEKCCCEVHLSVNITIQSGVGSYYTKLSIINANVLHRIA